MSIPTFSWYQGMRYVSWTGSSQLTSHTIVVVTSRVIGYVGWPLLHLHELPLVKEVDDVQFHPLTHQFWIDCC